MLELLRLLPLRFFAGSLGAGILYFLAQVTWLSWYAFHQCKEAPDFSDWDCTWQVYKQVPSALPLAAVFAAGLMVVLQAVARFMDSIPSSSDSWGVKTWVLVVVLSCSIAVVVLGLTVYSDEIPLPLTGFSAFVVYSLITQPWVDWVTRIAGAGRSGEDKGGG